jgi:hypothetical protein
MEPEIYYRVQVKDHTQADWEYTFNPLYKEDGARYFLNSLITNHPERMWRLLRITTTFEELPL